MGRIIVAAALLASALPLPLAAQAPSPAADAWQIGPIIRGTNHSVGMPLTPTQGRRGWYFDFPYPHARAGHVHYVTFNHGSLAGKERIVMRYRIDAAPGVQFLPREDPSQPATISLYFQRRGDSWSTKRGHEAYRWYAPLRTVAPLRAGEHTISVSLRDNWAAVMTSTAATNPRAFRDALIEAERVGFVLGSPYARGHGVYSTGPARLTVLSFQVI